MLLCEIGNKRMFDDVEEPDGRGEGGSHFIAVVKVECHLLLPPAPLTSRPLQRLARHISAAESAGGTRRRPGPRSERSSWPETERSGDNVTQQVLELHVWNQKV